MPRDDPYGSSTACPCCFLILSYLILSSARRGTGAPGRARGPRGPRQGAGRRLAIRKKKVHWLCVMYATAGLRIDCYCKGVELYKKWGAPGIRPERPEGKRAAFIRQGHGKSTSTAGSATPARRRAPGRRLVHTAGNIHRVTCAREALSDQRWGAPEPSRLSRAQLQGFEAERA